MATQIFIGGTGRSGTSILYDLLRSHKEIHAFKLEMRFIIDHNGLINLLDALTKNYSIDQSREALYYFEELMSKHLTNPYAPPYIGFEFDKIFSEEFYWKRLKLFLDELTLGSFYGADYSVSGNLLESKLSFLIRQIERLYNFYYRKVLNQNNKLLWPHRDLKIVKFFDDRKQLCLMAENFVNDLFMNAAHKENKSIWCEKTPLNVLHLDFLYEVFPNNHFIHIKRDPRGVLQSMQNQFWAPKKTEDLCLFMKQIYAKWFSVKEKIDFNKYNYLEIKLEDLAGNRYTVNEIQEFLDIDTSFINPPKLTLEKAEYWKKSMSKADVDIVNRMLHDEIEQMDY